MPLGGRSSRAGGGEASCYSGAMISSSMSVNDLMKAQKRRHLYAVMNGSEPELLTHSDSIGHHDDLASISSSTIASSCSASIFTSQRRKSLKRRKQRLQRLEAIAPPRMPAMSRKPAPISSTPPQLESPHFGPHLLLRAAGVSGKIPHRKTDLDGNSSQASCKSLATVQLDMLKDSPVMSAVVQGISSLGIQLEDAAKEVAGFRRGLGEVLLHSHSQYLLLFETTLAEVLSLQRRKERHLRLEVSHSRAEVEELQRKANEMDMRFGLLLPQVDALMALNSTLRAQKALAERKVEGLELQAEAEKGLNARIEELESWLAGKNAATTEKLAVEEAALWQRIMGERVAEAEDRARLASIASLQAVKSGQHGINHGRGGYLGEGGIPDPRKYRPVVPNADACVQTLANDDGLWDYADGCVREISRNTLLKALWRRARQFAGCPACKGAGNVLAIARSVESRQLLAKDRAAEDPTLEHRRLRKTDRVWSMPNALVGFLCNLPKTAQAMPIKTLPWLAKQIWSILDDRDRADAIDEAEGQPPQLMEDFIVELYLQRHGLRQEAELRLYELLVSVKAHYRRSILAHTFARLLNVLGGDEKASVNTSPRKNRGGDTDDFKPSNSPLDVSFLRALLVMRRSLLWRTARSEPKGGEQGGIIPEHIVTDEAGTSFWVPIADAAKGLQNLLGPILTPTASNACLRAVERGALLLTSRGALTSAEGYRTTIRSIVRRLENGLDYTTTGDALHGMGHQEGGEQQQIRPVVDMDRVLQICMEVLQQRERGIENELVRLFIQGDDNGDGVLSFDEFRSIVATAAPHFSERRILRMFREALTDGAASSFAIEKRVFCDVCRKHGLIQLIPSQETGHGKEGGTKS
jgi:hypothetical protein